MFKPFLRLLVAFAFVSLLLLSPLQVNAVNNFVDSIQRRGYLKVGLPPYNTPPAYYIDSESKELTGMRMIDSEGEILTREVKVKFVDGEPIFLEAVYIWKNTSDFDRFMRFANSYAKSNGLGYSEKK